MFRSLIRKKYFYLRNFTQDHIDENLCVVMKNTSEVVLETRRTVQPKNSELLIEVKSVCMSLKDFFLHAKYYSKNRTNMRPVVLGSFASGVVLKTGGGMHESFDVGDRVVLEPGISCMTCEFCTSGQTNLCPDISYIGTQEKDGAMCQYVTHPVSFCHKLDNNISFDTATLIPKIACSVHAYDRAGITDTNTKVLLLGSGLTGLIMLMVLKELGVKNVCVAETSNYRLEHAKNLGADYVLKIAPKLSPEYPEYTREILYAIFSEQADVTIDTICDTFSTETSFHLTKSGGKVILMSLSSSAASAKLIQASVREINVIGAHSYTKNSFVKAMDFVQKESLPLTSILPLKVPLLKAVDALSYSRATNENVYIIMNCNETNKEIYSKSEEKKTAAVPQSTTAELDQPLLNQMKSKVEDLEKRMESHVFDDKSWEKKRLEQDIRKIDKQSKDKLSEKHLTKDIKKIDEKSSSNSRSLLNEQAESIHSPPPEEHEQTKTHVKVEDVIDIEASVGQKMISEEIEESMKIEKESVDKYQLESEPTRNLESNKIPTNLAEKNSKKVISSTKDENKQLAKKTKTEENKINDETLKENEEKHIQVAKKPIISKDKKLTKDEERKQTGKQNNKKTQELEKEDDKNQNDSDK